MVAAAARVSGFSLSFRVFFYIYTHIPGGVFPSVKKVIFIPHKTLKVGLGNLFLQSMNMTFTSGCICFWILKLEISIFHVMCMVSIRNKLLLVLVTFCLVFTSMYINSFLQ